MKTNNLDCAKFYEERDSRTLKLVGSDDYRNRHILIATENTHAATRNGQTMCLFSLNLIARFCRNVSVAVPDGPLLVKVPRIDATTLHEAFLQLSEAIDPCGDFHICSGPRTCTSYDVVLAIGSPNIEIKAPVVFIDSDGWRSYVGETRPTERVKGVENAIGALAASCLGSAEVFKHLLGEQGDLQNTRNAWFSTFDFSVNSPASQNPSLPSSISCGKIQTVGVGAVANATIWSLPLLPVQANLALIDPEKIELSNTNRYSLAFANDVGRAKVEVARGFLERSAIATEAYEMAYDDFVKRFGVRNDDVVLPLVDNNKARHQVQLNMPRFMIHGSTDNWTFSVGRHRALEDDCLICRYPNVGEMSQQACGTIEAPELDSSANADFSAAVSFVSALPGVIVAGELVKMGYANYPFTYNFFQMDMSSTPDRARHFNRKPREDCVCQKDWFRSVYKRRLQVNQI